MDMIENMTYDCERALYNIRDTHVKGCTVHLQELPTANPFSRRQGISL